MKIKTISGRDLTLKQRKWLKYYLELGNATDAAMRAYNTKDREDAANIGYQNYRKLDVQELLERQGLSDVFLNHKLLEGLESNKQLATRVIFKKDAPTSQSARELPMATGMTDDFIEVPDMQTRHKYLETAYKLKGRLNKNEGGALNIDGNNIQINVIGGGYIPKSSSVNGAPEGSDIQSREV